MEGFFDHDLGGVFLLVAEFDFDRLGDRRLSGSSARLVWRRSPTRSKALPKRIASCSLAGVWLIVIFADEFGFVFIALVDADSAGGEGEA